MIFVWLFKFIRHCHVEVIWLWFFSCFFVSSFTCFFVMCLFLIILAHLLNSNKGLFDSWLFCSILNHLTSSNLSFGFSLSLRLTFMIHLLSRQIHSGLDCLSYTIFLAKRYLIKYYTINKLRINYWDYVNLNLTHFVEID